MSPVTFSPQADTIDLDAIVERNADRVEGLRPVKVGDEVWLRDLSNGEADEDTPAEVRGTVTVVYNSIRFGTMAVINGNGYYLNDYASRSIVGVSAKDDIDALVAAVKSLREQLREVQAVRQS